MKNIISIISLLIVATSAIDDVIATNESSSKPTAMKEDNQLIRRRKTKSAKSSDSSDGGGGSDTSDAIPFIEDTPDDDSSMSMSMPNGADDPFIGLVDSDASMPMPDIDSSSESVEEEEESVVAYGDTKDGATIDQWHAFVSTLDATHESYTPPDSTDESEEEDESDSIPSRADSPWHDFMITLDAIHESYTPPPAEAESIEDTDGEDTTASASIVDDMSMSTTASSMSMPPGDGREEGSESDSGSSKARKLSTAHDTTNIHGRKTKIGITRMKTKMNEDELPWGDDSDHSMSMPIRVSEVQYTVAADTADIEEVHSMPNSKSSKGKTWKTKSAKAKSSKADDHHITMSMPNHSKSGKAKSSKRL